MDLGVGTKGLSPSSSGERWTQDVRSSTLPIAVSIELRPEPVEGRASTSSARIVSADSSKVRWRLDVAYDGTNFSGWAAQLDRRTVQGELETWISRVLRLDEQPRLVCAGR